MKRTLEDIRRDGLNALRERLGRAGMVRFLQQFENGRGDYSKERRQWANRTSLADLKRQLNASAPEKPRAARKRRHAA